jgi:hypothetical protein
MMPGGQLIRLISLETFPYQRFQRFAVKWEA